MEEFVWLQHLLREILKSKTHLRPRKCRPYGGLENTARRLRTVNESPSKANFKMSSNYAVISLLTIAIKLFGE